MADLYKADGTVITIRGHQYALKVNPIDGLLYWYVDGKKTGNGVDIGHHSSIDVSDIVSYLQQPTLDALSYVDDLGTDYVHYVVLTDCHVNTEKNKSPAIIALLMQTGLFDKYINLGDMAARGGSTTWHQWAFDNGYFYGLDDGQMLFAMGNHDTDNDVVPYSQWYTDVMSKMPTNCVFDDVPDADKMYYYYDNDEYKIRFIVNSYYAKSGEAEFLKNAYNTASNDYKVIKLGHSGSLSAEDATKWQYENTKLLSWLCGHEEADKVYKYYDWIYRMVFLGDGFGSDGYGAITRVAGTTDDVSITIASFNPSTNSAKFYRIGAICENNISELLPVTDNKEFEYTQSPTPPSIIDGYRIGQTGVLSADARTQFHTAKIPITANQKWYFWRDDGTEIAEPSRTIQLSKYSGDTFSTWVGRNTGTQYSASPYVYVLTASGSATIGQLIYPADVNISGTPPAFN